ncbi:MAG: SDR family NAD(P)-dependent oxidoreductase [Armatimonadetes bacterium]|nr:SDR family NAD(P)-dependent oxidoreductase [Armatimonadota bacterium]
MSGRTVIVTGASSGIGEATARAFGRAGDRVVLTARRVDRLQRLAAELPDSLVVQADLTKPEEIGRIVSETLGRYETIDVLVNNAGLGQYDWLERLTDEEIRTEVEVNLIAPILLTRAVLPAMLARRRGVIINVASVAGRIGLPTMAIYSTTKFGLHGVSEALYRELRPRGVHVCTIYPGGVAGTESGRKHRVRLSGTPGWLRLTTEQVAAEIVALADHPRPRRIVPWVFAPVVALNALVPSVVDAVTMRAVRRALAAPLPPRA